MDTKTKAIYISLITTLILSVSASYYRYIVNQDFLTEVEIDCDPTIESCFVWVCDPNIDGEGVCTGNNEEDTWYFKYAYRNAKNFPACDNPTDGCDQITCNKDEEECEEATCTDELLIEHGISGSCTSPTDFNNIEPITNHY